MEVEIDMSLVFHPEVPTGCFSRVYDAPSKELCVCATDNISIAYISVILIRKKNIWKTALQFHSFDLSMTAILYMIL